MYRVFYTVLFVAAAMLVLGPSPALAASIVTDDFESYTTWSTAAAPDTTGPDADPGLGNGGLVDWRSGEA